jgi:hypothetical protein
MASRHGSQRDTGSRATSGGPVGGNAGLSLDVNQRQAAALHYMQQSRSRPGDRPGEDQPAARHAGRDDVVARALSSVRGQPSSVAQPAAQAVSGAQAGRGQPSSVGQPTAQAVSVAQAEAEGATPTANEVVCRRFVETCLQNGDTARWKNYLQRLYARLDAHTARGVKDSLLASLRGAATQVDMALQGTLGEAEFARSLELLARLEEVIDEVTTDRFF